MRDFCVGFSRDRDSLCDLEKWPRRLIQVLSSAEWEGGFGKFCLRDLKVPFSCFFFIFLVTYVLNCRFQKRFFSFKMFVHSQVFYSSFLCVTVHRCCPENVDSIVFRDYVVRIPSKHQST